MHNEAVLNVEETEWAKEKGIYEAGNESETDKKFFANVCL